MPVHLPGQRKVDEGEKCWRQVCSTDWGRADFAVRNLPGERHDQRPADIGIVGSNLLLEAFLSPGDSLIGRKDNQGVVLLAGFLQSFAKAAHGIIDREHALMILADPVL